VQAFGNSNEVVSPSPDTYEISTGRHDTGGYRRGPAGGPNIHVKIIIRPSTTEAAPWSFGGGGVVHSPQAMDDPVMATGQK
jgi:hypothetical protein